MQEIVKNSKIKKEKEIVKSKTGITLIALVVTVIVLLILAGVTIATLTGNNGIIIQAKQAKENNNSETVKEKVEVEILKSIDKKGNLDENTFEKNVTENIKGSTVTKSGNSLIVKADGYEVTVDKESGEVIEVAKSDEKTPITGVTPGTIVGKTEKNNYSDGTDTATVPQGFTVSGIPGEQKIANGLVIYDIPESEITNVDWNTASTKYNQFVWIPVESEESYQRDFSYPSYYDSVTGTTPANSTFTDTGYLPTDIQPTIDNATNNETAERTAVLKYNGFYISRYEIGIENLKLVSKQNSTVYTNKRQTELKAIGKDMYGDSSTYVKSAMCSGIQWDMVMKFVDKKTDENGNTYDVRKYEPTRHAEDVKEAGKNLADKVQNIYDLEGNCLEYVAEKNNTSTSFPFVIRGGFYLHYSYLRASLRIRWSGSADSYTTFRSALYIK